MDRNEGKRTKMKVKWIKIRVKWTKVRVKLIKKPFFESFLVSLNAFQSLFI